MKKRGKKRGRKPKINKDVLQKLEDAFTNAFSDEQACAYADICPSTLYNYQKRHPEFLERKVQLKLRPDIKAKQTIAKALGDPNHAWRWLERRDPEFKPTSKLEHAGSIEVADLTINMSPEEIDALAKLSVARRKRIEQQSDQIK